MRLAFVDASSEGDADASMALSVVADAAVLLGPGPQLSKLVQSVAGLMSKGTWAKAKDDAFLAGFLGQVSGSAGDANIARLMGAKPGMGKVATAGRVFEASDAMPFNRHDFVLAEEAEWASRAKHIANIVGRATFPKVPAEDVTVDFLSHVALVSCGMVGEQANDGARRQQIPQQWKGAMSGFTVGDKQSLVHVTAFLDPLSQATQRMAPLLMALSRAFGAQIQVFLNPKAVINEIPIKGYFRYVLTEELQFGESGALQAQHKASFTNLPTTKLLTMAIHTPDAWFVEVSARDVATRQGHRSVPASQGAFAQSTSRSLVLLFRSLYMDDTAAWVRALFRP